MKKMSDAAERVTELEKNLKTEVRNMEKRWRVLKHWSHDYSLDLQRVVMEWRVIQQEQKSVTEWLDAKEERLSTLNEKVDLIDQDGRKQQLKDLKVSMSNLIFASLTICLV